jgi:DNA-binding NarL/FixJ family response regulator
VATAPRFEIAAAGPNGRPVVALAAREHVLVQQLAAALDASGIKVGSAVLLDHGAGVESFEAAADVVACACDPLCAEHAADIRRVRAALPAVALLVVVTAAPRDPAPAVRRALSLGADGVVLEDELERTLAPAVLAVAGGQVAVPGAGRRSLQRPQLSYREKQVLALAVSGHTNAEIGARLYLAESTVKSHMTAAFRRLGVASRREAAALLLDPDEGLGPAVLAAAQVHEVQQASP